jgi:hypothetical protein
MLLVAGPIQGYGPLEPGPIGPGPGGFLRITLLGSSVNRGLAPLPEELKYFSCKTAREDCTK